MQQTIALQSPVFLPKGPPGEFIFGNLRQYQRDGLQFYVDAWKRYGDTVRTRMGPLTQHLVVRPEHVKHVLMTNADNYCKGVGFRKIKLFLGEGLLTSEGPQWKSQRRLAQPAFTAKNVMNFVKPLGDATGDVLQRWHNQPSGKPVAVAHEMMGLAMDVISRTLLSRPVRDEADALGSAISTAFDFVSRRTVTVVDVPLFLPTADNRRFKRALATIDGFVDEILRERRNGAPVDDLLGALMAARDDDSKGMSDALLRNQIFTLYLAGHETTALTLTWVWYLLSQNPHIEEALHAEVDSVLSGGMPTREDLPKLPYTWMVVQEAMRLYPPIWMLPRDAIKADTIDGCTIPARSMVVVSPYLTHRHPDYWEQPEVFNPERFTPAAIKERATGVYIPFGVGPRICLGTHFAALEATMVLAGISQHWRLRLPAGHPVTPVAQATLRPRDPLMMTLERRTKG